jgi:uncharacterized membrane protein YsdA (DUF1294 family)
MAFGFADYVVTFAVSFIVSFENWYIFLILCGGFGMLTGFVRKSHRTEHIPFIPAILLSTLLTTLIFG